MDCAYSCYCACCVVGERLDLCWLADSFQLNGSICDKADSDETSRVARGDAEKGGGVV